MDLDLKAEARQSQYRVSRALSGGSRTAKLFNLGKIIEEKHGNHRCGTMRVVRIYHHEDSRLELKGRIDWDPPILRDERGWIGADDTAILNTSDLDQRGLRDFVKDAKAIVVQDMNKGVISSALIKWLTEVAREAEWFVSTRAWRPVRDPAVPVEEPDWLRALETAKERVRLLVIPHTAAERAVDEGDLGCWITANGVPSSEALQRVDKLSHRFSSAAIVVMPKGLTILAYLGADRGVVQTTLDAHTIEGEHEGAGVPMTSVFFPAITAYMLNSKSASPNDALEEALKRALDFTHRWMKKEVERIEHSEREDLEPEVLLNLDHTPEEAFGQWNRVEWHATQQHWNQAFKECGIINKNSNSADREHKVTSVRCVGPWRTMTDVPGYVCCIPSKRNAIRHIRKELALFKKEPRQSKSFMLMASPGSGKTRFATQLAKAHGLGFVEFNITQMLSKSDILDCFDTVVTKQAQDDRPLLVFFDEINAVLNSQHVYDIFLAPIEKSAFVRGGKTFRIPACAWLFAGTENPGEHPDKSAKGSDFVSRLSLQPINFRPETWEEADLITEHVYLGVSLLKLAFSDITEISEKVLRAFEFLRPDVDVRQIQRLAYSFSGIQHEKVLSRNIPLDQFKSLTDTRISHQHHFESWWKERPEGDMITIEREDLAKETPKERSQGGKIESDELAKKETRPETITPRRLAA